MIGIFDSGSGWLTFLAAMRRRFPAYGYLYFGDYDHCPYGDKTPEEIQSLTIAGVQKLFDAGATIVILACNTASAWTLRKLQTEIFPDRRILWVTIPWAERAVELNLKRVTVFATEQTVTSKTYAERVHILNADVLVRERAFDGSLVREIESLLPIHRCHTQEDFLRLAELYDINGWQCDGEKWRDLASRYVKKEYVMENDPTSKSGIILGCTHYSYLKKTIQNLFPNMSIIDPSEESAEKFERYTSAHPDAVSGIAKTGKVVFL